MNDEANALPDYLAEHDDGSITVKLLRGLEVDGTKVTALKLREPDVSDQLIADSVKGSDLVKESTMIANLAGITPDQAKKLKSKDYKRAQDALRHFMS
jgi:hypothetical protein